MVLVNVGQKSSLKPGQGKTVSANGKAIALFNVDGTFYAIDNTCKHRGGPLGQGMLDGNIVMCPWHGWQYDVCTGECTTPGVKVNAYKVEVKGEDIFVDV